MKRKKNRWIRKIIWGIIFLALLSGVIWASIPSWTVSKLKFVTIQAGTIEHKVPLQATFANEEYLLPAPDSGKLVQYAKTGDRYRRGEIVAAVQTGGIIPGGKAKEIPINAPEGGLFFPAIDGLETVITENNLLNTNLENLLAQSGNPQIAKNEVQSGQIVGKIVNNLQPTTAFLKMPAINTIKPDQKLNLVINGQKQSAQVIRRSEKPLGVVVRFNYYINGTAEKRTQEVSWIENPGTSGVLIPKSALWNRGEEQGVFVVIEGVFHFRSVQIVDEDEANICVSDLASGVAVVTNPREGIEGLAVSF